MKKELKLKALGNIYGKNDAEDIDLNNDEAVEEYAGQITEMMKVYKDLIDGKVKTLEEKIKSIEAVAKKETAEPGDKKTAWHFEAE